MKELKIINLIVVLALFNIGTVHANDTIYSHVKKHETKFISCETFDVFKEKSQTKYKETRATRDIITLRWNEYTNADGSKYYKYTVRYRLTTKQAKKAKKAEQKIVSKAMKKKKTDCLKYMYRQLIGGVRYSRSRNQCYTSYGPLVMKKASCQGLSLAFADMCRMAEFSAKIVDGWNSHNNESHMWVAVRQKGKWKYFDPTWDLGEQKLRYFSRSASYMKKSGHVFSRTYITF